MLPNIVGGTIAVQTPELGALSSSCAVAILLNVVLHEWILGPAIHGDEDGTTCCGGTTIEGDVSDEQGISKCIANGCCRVTLPRSTLRPTLSDDKVRGSREGDRVAV